VVSQIQSRGLLLVSLSVNTVCWAADSKIIIRVYSDVALSNQILSQAEAEGTRIFQQAKVQTVWVNCESSFTPTASHCHDAPDGKHLVLRIVPKALSAADSIFGMAFLAANGGGVYGDVFFDSIEVLHRDYGASSGRVLGHVMAHEVGHLLLGTNSHSLIGIMRPSWHGEELRMLAMGSLFFTPEQARVMRDKISNLQPS
jgi:hypothetical protein